MILPPDIVRLIQSNTKTMHRWPAHLGSGKCPYKRGGLYIVQASRKDRPACRVTIIEEPYQQQFVVLTPADVRREGFKRYDELVQRWQEQWGPDFDPSWKAWVIRFVKGDIRDTDRYLAARSPNEFCVCGRAFADNQRVCKCGRRRPEESMDDHGYTTNPFRRVRGEQAAIPAELQERYTQESRELARAAEIAPIVGRGQRIANEINELRRELAGAGRRRKDIERSIELLERALDRLRRKVADAA